MFQIRPKANSPRPFDTRTDFTQAAAAIAGRKRFSAACDGATPMRSLDRMSTRRGQGRLSLAGEKTAWFFLYRWTFSRQMSNR
jgi:hypothetical protein